MATDRSEFKIKISTEADLSGAKAHIAALEGQREALRQMGKETKDVDAEISKLQHSVNQAELFGVGKNAEEAGEKFKIFGRGAHEAHAALEAVNQALPGTTDAIRFLFTPVTAIIGGLALAFGFLKDKLNELNQTLDAINTPSARGEWAQKLAENAKEAAVETAVYNEHLREEAQKLADLSAATDRVIEAQHRQFATAKAVADAQKELDIARLALAEKLGQVTPDQAVLIRLQIDDAAFKRELDAKKAQIQAELGAREHEAAANQSRLKGLANTRDNAQFDSEDAKDAADKNAAKLAQDKANLEKEQAALDIAQTKYEEASKFYRVDNIITKESAVLAEQIKQKEDLLGSLRHAIAQETAKDTPLSAAAAVAKEQAEKAKADFEAARSASEQILQTVAKLQADLDAAAKQNATLQLIHYQTSAAKAAAVDSDDTENQDSYAHLLPGPQAAIDASAAIERAREIEANVRDQKPGDRNPGQMAELHDLLNRIIGLQENSGTELTGQRGELSEQRHRIEMLESQQVNNRYNY